MIYREEEEEDSLRLHIFLPFAALSEDSAVQFFQHAKMKYELSTTLSITKIIILFYFILFI